MTTPLKFDAAPLIEWATRQAALATGLDVADVPATAIADRLGVRRPQVWHWRKPGAAVMVRHAEAAADRLGMYPTELWPDWHTAHDRYVASLSKDQRRRVVGPELAPA